MGKPSGTPGLVPASKLTGLSCSRVTRGSFARMGEAMRVIREYLNELEAQVARSVLEANDIPAVVLRDNAGGMLPVMHILYPVRLAVRVADAARALDILDSSFTAGSDADDDAFGVESPDRA
jgi:hypothetical protein